ncbi:MAG: HDOD domain-containing protein [Peptococcaceae bacterium]|nr:HDOD domain-containing protein [Peptococcaceae bacterium]
MKIFIVATPIFDANMVVEAYDLKYQRCDLPLGSARMTAELDGATFSPGLEFLNSVGTDAFTNNKKIFVPVDQYLLLANFADLSSIPPELLVCVINKDFPLEPRFLLRCMKMKQRGYFFALNNVQYTLKTAVLFELADYIILNTDSKDFGDNLLEVRTKKPSAVAICTNIESKDFFNKIKGIPNALFEGRFYSRPLSKGVKKISPLKSNALQLLKAVGSEEEPDFEVSDIAKYIQRDAALSIALLRFINSPAIGLRQKVNSISHAIAMLGLKQTRKWVMAAISAYLAFDEPNELTRLILVRAKFAENLASTFHMENQSGDLFLMGVLSLLDVVMEAPISVALREVSAKQVIFDALASHEGPFYHVLELIFAYEHADWERVSQIMILNALTAEGIQGAFLNAMLWYKQLLLDNEEEA